MRKPKDTLLVLIAAVVIAVNALPLKVKRDNEKELPHSRDYYDGYIKALVDHYQEIFRHGREIKGEKDSASVALDSSDGKTADSTVVLASKKSDMSEDAIKPANNSNKPVEPGTADQKAKNTTSNNVLYKNPEQPRQPTLSDTELSESATPDAHKKNENKKQDNQKSVVLKRAKAENAKDQLMIADDQDKLPETMQDIKYFTAASADLEDMKKRSTEDSSELEPANQDTGLARAAVQDALIAKPATKRTAEMESESKVISHSSSTYTPGNPFKNAPSKGNNQPASQLAKPNMQLQIPSAKSSPKESSQAESELESDEPDAPENNQFMPEPKYFNAPIINQQFMPVLLVPVPVDGSRFASAGSRNAAVVKRGKGDEDKKDDKDDDDEDEEEPETSYLAPLHGHPGWFEAGHGIPYGYSHGGYAYHPHSYGHHGSGHHGSGHHGHGHNMVLDNGVMWPFGESNMHTPCGCDGANGPFSPLIARSLPRFVY